MNQEYKSNLLQRTKATLKKVLSNEIYISVLTISLSLGLSSYLFWTSYTTYKNTKEMTKATYLKIQSEIAQEALQHKIDSFIRLNDNIVQFIITQKDLLSRCETLPPSPYEQAKKRFPPRDFLEIEVQNGQQLGYLNKDISNAIQRAIDKDRLAKDNRQIRRFTAIINK